MTRVSLPLGGSQHSQETSKTRGMATRKEKEKAGKSALKRVKNIERHSEVREKTSAEIYDNSQLSSFKSCNRQGYFAYNRYWVPTEPRMPLIFGECWHAAMDVIWAGISKDPKIDISEIVTKATAAFMLAWEAHSLPDIDQMSGEVTERFGHRNPMTAIEMLYAYVDTRRSFISSCELISIEQPFAILLDPSEPDLFYVGRLDKVIRVQDEIILIEHKTTTLYSKSTGFRQDYIESFSPNSQIDGYMAAGRVLYGDKCKAIYVDAALVHRDIHDKFKFLPIRRMTSQLDAWLWETRHWIDEVKRNKEALKKVKSTDNYMAAYPRNTNECQGKYGACVYQDICKGATNPSKQKDPPIGFKYEKWEPFDTLGLHRLNLGGK